MSLCLTNNTPFRLIREMEVYLHVFLTLALYGIEWLASCSGHFTPDTHWIRVRVCPTDGLEAAVKRKSICNCRESNPAPPSRSLVTKLTEDHLDLRNLLVALPPGKKPWYPLDRRLGGPQSRSGRGDEGKNKMEKIS
jgi:hypothetical protein